ncbi:MAG: UDP-N-acetylglucosamine 1-carboxyvinyltransferase [Chloroflexi bacterium]|nr:UDP-N-acetylglucosamine 1-carboxyvinyltransferase [Chloroflexota bacterium]MBV9898038.1 UDP-N-acetylglucosamine 1-carboxyvinyltransferase [Chloroflexota bacterium]
MAEPEPGGENGEACRSESTAYVIDGGEPLRGTIPVSGAKNAVLKLMAAAVLCEDPCTISNAPRIADVEYILETLRDLGAEACWIGEHTLRIHARDLDWDFIPLEAAKRLRASFVLLGPMLGRRRKVIIPNPGGDRIGRRPVNVHVDALRALGAEIDYKWGYYYARAPRGLRGTQLRLPEASVTGTENVLMSAVLADGRTIITNAAAEPEVDNLIDFLNRMGGQIKRSPDDAHTIIVDGVSHSALHGASIDVIPDRIEAGSFAVAAAITGGEVLLKGARADHLDAFISALRHTGIEVSCEADGLRVGGKPPFREHRINTAIYPGFPTDLQAPFSLALVEADGVSTIKENLYEDRFDYAAALQRMGANIHVFDAHTAAIYGPCELHGSEVEIPDLRAGATLVLAALAAEGTSRISGIEHVARGYEDMVGKLGRAGARITEEHTSCPSPSNN